MLARPLGGGNTQAQPLRPARASQASRDFPNVTSAQLPQQRLPREGDQEATDMPAQSLGGGNNQDRSFGIRPARSLKNKPKAQIPQRRGGSGKAFMGDNKKGNKSFGNTTTTGNAPTPATAIKKGPSSGPGTTKPKNNNGTKVTTSTKAATQRASAVTNDSSKRK